MVELLNTKVLLAVPDDLRAQIEEVWARAILVAGVTYKTGNVTIHEFDDEQVALRAFSLAKRVSESEVKP